MRAPIIQLRAPCLLVIILFIFQGCRVYHKEAVSLEQATHSQKRVRIETKSGENIKFKRMELKDGYYFGYVQKQGEEIEVPIDESDVVSVREHNKGMSIFWGVITGVGYAAIVSYVTLFALLFLFL